MGDPYCSNCGYSLVGATRSALCPECGRPLVEVLQRRGAAPAGRRYTSPIVIFGLPLLQIAQGPSGDERFGRACGVVAIGDQAFGLLAIGGLACGVFAFGGLALGVFALGGLAGGLCALGGVAVSGLAAGGVALGALAGGGVAIGYIVYNAGVGIGYFARGGQILAEHPLGGNAWSATGRQFFSDNAWLLGQGPFGFTVLLWGLAAALLTAAALFLLVVAGYLLRRDKLDGGSA